MKKWFTIDATFDDIKLIDLNAKNKADAIAKHRHNWAMLKSKQWTFRTNYYLAFCEEPDYSLNDDNNPFKAEDMVLQSIKTIYSEMVTEIGYRIPKEIHGDTIIL